MAYSIEEYRQLFLNLLPSGRAWSRNPSGLLYKLMHAFADEFHRVDGRSDTLRIELDTRYAGELLIDHEIDLGLPDECVSEAISIAQRRQIAHTKFIQEGGLHKQSYIDLADDLGYRITITEFSPAWAGIACAGDPCGPQENIFYVQVATTIGIDDWRYFTCGSSLCGDYLIEVSDTTALQCILNKFKPAHVRFIYTYTGYDFSSAFSSAFNAIPVSDIAYMSGAFDRSFGLGFNAYYGGGDFDIDAFDGSFFKPV